MESITECRRVLKNDGQLVFTLNLESTMHEFYEVFKTILKQNGLNHEIDNLRDHIFKKRKPLGYIIRILLVDGFEIHDIRHNEFKLKFVDGTTMFNHFLIKLAFLEEWKSIIDQKVLKKIFNQIEEKLNEIAEISGELSLSVPFVTMTCSKNE